MHKKTCRSIYLQVLFVFIKQKDKGRGETGDRTYGEV